MRMRHYSPQLGRFLQPDPAGIAGGINLYAYSNNNPLRYFDPWGLWPAPDASGGSDGKYGEMNSSRYRRISRWIHGILSVAGAVPLFGVIPDAVDLIYTLAELPSGHSSGTDVVLGAAAVVAVITPGPGDAAAAAKIANRALDAGEVIAKNADVAADAASSAARNLPTPNRGPDFVVTPSGTAHPVPSGATGPTSTRAPGMQYTGGSGGPGMDSRTSGGRFMDATPYHNERVSYMNRSGQTVDPATGQTIPPNHPRAHIPPD